MQARVVLSRLSLASLSVSVSDYYVFHFLREGGCFFYRDEGDEGDASP